MVPTDSVSGLRRKSETRNVMLYAQKITVSVEIVVIMEDTHAQLKKVMNLFPRLTEKFTERISIPVFTSDELVEFAKSYAKEYGYVFEEMAILALYNRISGIQKVDRATYIVEVKEIMDDAIASANRKTIGHFFAILAAKRYDDEDMIIIRENDFE